MAQSRWQPRFNSETDSVSKNYEEFKNLPQKFLEFLSARKIQDKRSLESLIQPKLLELKNPYLIQGMHTAVERFAQAFIKKEKICVYADFDLDGTSGLALLTKGLKDLGFENVLHYQPKRLSEGYGFHAHAVEDLKAQGVSLIITVDVGINAHEACLKAKELGIEVIITDHHQPAETLPEATCVVNPNQKGCESELGYLCGAGVAFYFVRALKRGLLEQGLVEENTLDLKSLLDCFCIGTLTDMVPMIDDNRTLVKFGLIQLENTKRPGLRCLLKSLDLWGRPLTSQDVAIRFAPKLNALSRMEIGIFPIDLFLVEDEAEAELMVKTVLKNNSMRVTLQASAEKKAQDLLSGWSESDFVFCADSEFHRGVIGLIATKLSQDFNKAAFVGSITEDGNIVGSSRLPNDSSFSLVKALDCASEALIRHGGHNAAAGFELKVENQARFVELLKKYFSEQAHAEELPSMEYDTDLRLLDVDENLVKWIDRVGPYGQSFALPLWKFQKVFVKELNVLKGGHIKLKLMQSELDRPMEALYFSPPPKVFKNLSEQKSEGLSQIDFIGELQWNYFNGRKSVQILIKEIVNIFKE